MVKIKEFILGETFRLPDLKTTNIFILVLRITLVGFILTHGLPKLFMVFNTEVIVFADPIGIGPMLSLLLVVFAEVFCSLLILAGLFIRVATIPPIITMLVAAFVVHAGEPFSNKEMAFLYLIIYSALLVLGAGEYSLDFVFRKSSVKN